MGGRDEDWSKESNQDEGWVSLPEIRAKISHCREGELRRKQGTRGIVFSLHEGEGMKGAVNTDEKRRREDASSSIQPQGNKFPVDR